VSIPWKKKFPRTLIKCGGTCSHWNMTAEGIALILSAVATLVTALAAAVVLILRRDVAAVHTLVNQNRTDMLAYQADLVEALQAGGLIVPRDKSTD
jgi:hypothetical protein